MTRRKSIQNRLLVTTALAMSSLVAYGRQAYADCVNNGGSTYLCTGSGGPQTINADDADVTAGPGFEATAEAGEGDAIRITGNGALSFTDDDTDPTGSGSDDGDGLYISSGGNGTMPGSVTIVTHGDFVGRDGIDAENSGSGSIDITANGEVYGHSEDGIEADNYSDGFNLTITTGENSVVTGYEDGIDAENSGSGAITITANGDVHGLRQDGIEADSFSNSTDLTVTTGAGSLVTGYEDGIDAESSASDSAITITANGDVYGYTQDGIEADLYSDGADLTITTGAGSTVRGYLGGINAQSSGSGAITITANGDVYGYVADGIAADNYSGTAIEITTGEGSYVYGGQDGIDAENFGSQSLAITVGGEVVGATQDGVDAENYGTELTIETGTASSISGFGDGINALNEGSGDLTVDTGMDSTVSGYNIGINVENAGGGGLSITTGEGSEVYGGYHGIHALNYGSGALMITSAGDVSGATGDGIYAYGGVYNTGLTIDAATASGGEYGIYANSIYGGGDVSITASGTVTGGNSGIGGRTGGNTTGLAIETADVSGEYAGVVAYHGGSGILSITSTGDVEGEKTAGIVATNYINSDGMTIDAANVSGGYVGILAIHYGSGALEITSTGEVEGGANAGPNFAAAGIIAATDTNATDLTINANDVSGDDVGILAAHEGTEVLSITTTGDVSGDFGITAAAGVDAAGLTIDVANVSGESDDGIYAHNYGTGMLSITTSGTVEGDLSAIRAQASGGTIEIANSGAIRNVSELSSDLAIAAQGGTTEIENSGSVTGRVELGDMGDEFINLGSWFTTGTSDFGGGNDFLENVSGAMLVTAGNGAAAETTVFSGLEQFESAGRLTLADGGVGDTTTFSGTFEGTGGTVLLDVELGGAGSLADMLVIGGDSSGDTILLVNVVGGTGGATSGDGIKVVQVDGSSAADAFTLGTPLTMGIYNYNLFYGGIADPGDGDWYLRSTIAPQGSAYQALPQMLFSFNHVPTLADRLGGRAWSGPMGSGIWTRVDGAHGSYHAASATILGEYESTWWRMEAGADMEFEPAASGGRLVAGLSAHTGRLSANIASAGSDFDLDSSGHGVGATLTWYGAGGTYVDAQARATWFDSDLGTATGVTGNDGFGYAFSLEIGHQFDLAREWTVTPQAQITYSQIDFDSFTDASGTHVALSHGESLKSRIGVAIGRDADWEDASGSVYHAQFHGLANLIYEHKGQTRVVAGGAALDWTPQRLWGEIGLGASIEANDRLSVFGEATLAGSLSEFADSHSVGGKIGLQVAW